MIYHTYDEIRAALACRLGHGPKEEVWDRLVEDDYVREVWEETAEIDYLEEKYREFNRIPGRLLQPPKSAIDSGPRQIRLQILSDLTARQAATEKSVIAFRRQHLTEGLLKRQEVVEWITRQAAEEGPASHYLRVPIPDGYEPIKRNGRIVTKPLLTISDTTAAVQVEMELLSYASPDDQWVERIPVGHGGTLDRLRMLTKSLARRFTWQEAQVTTFVLTDISPALSSLRGGIRMAFSQPISSRISMEIDPTLTPEEVAEQYKRLRATLIGARYRSMSEKHLRLAEFYGGHKPEGITWGCSDGQVESHSRPGLAIRPIRAFRQGLYPSMATTDGPGLAKVSRSVNGHPKRLELPPHKDRGGKDHRLPSHNSKTVPSTVNDCPVDQGSIQSWGRPLVRPGSLTRVPEDPAGLGTLGCPPPPVPYGLTISSRVLWGTLLSSNPNSLERT